MTRSGKLSEKRIHISDRVPARETVRVCDLSDGDIEAILAANPLPLEYHIAQLRHAYSHLMAERVTDQRQFADGLIAPAIRAFERHLSTIDDK